MPDYSLPEDFEERTSSLSCCFNHASYPLTPVTTYYITLLMLVNTNLKFTRR